MIITCPKIIWKNYQARLRLHAIKAICRSQHVLSHASVMGANNSVEGGCVPSLRGLSDYYKLSPTPEQEARREEERIERERAEREKARQRQRDYENRIDDAKIAHRTVQAGRDVGVPETKRWRDSVRAFGKKVNHKRQALGEVAAPKEVSNIRSYEVADHDVQTEQEAQEEQTYEVSNTAVSASAGPQQQDASLPPYMTVGPLQAAQNVGMTVVSFLDHSSATSSH